jgi:hypothetical protein
MIHNISIVFHVSTELIRIIKMRLAETYSEALEGILFQMNFLFKIPETLR